MKPTTSTLNTLLGTREFYMVDLYQFSLISGTQLYYCSGDADITWNGHLWTAGGTIGPYFDRKDNKAKCHQKVGVEVDTLVFDALPGAATIGAGNVPFLSAIRIGLFDGAEMTLNRAYMPFGAYGNLTNGGVVTMFAGRIAEIDASRNLATFTINSHLELLNQSMPHNIYQSGCNNSLYDLNCTAVQGSFSSSGTCNSSASQSVVVGTGAFTGAPNDYYDMGMLTFTSGQNAGLSKSIKQFTTSAGVGTVQMASPFPYTPANGDTFTIAAGCDKSQATCLSKFNNIQHFRGYPYIPIVETAV